jgi:hypothetical protein
MSTTTAYPGTSVPGAPPIDETSIATLRWYHRHGRAAWYAVDTDADGRAVGWVVDGADPAADRIASFRPEAIERIRDVVPDPSFAPASLREIQAAHREWDAGERYASALPGRTWGLLVFLLLVLAALGGGAFAMTRSDPQVPRGRLVALAPVELRAHDVRLPVKPIPPHARGGAAHTVIHKKPHHRPPHHQVVNTQPSTPPAPPPPPPPPPPPTTHHSPSPGNCGPYKGAGFCG